MLAAVWTAGCGLSAYEAKMAAEQKRIETLDEENKLLGDPIELPQDGNASGLPLGVNSAAKKAPEIFLRLPRSLSSKSDPGTYGDILHHFGRVQTSSYGRGYGQGNDAKANPFEDAYVGVTANQNFDDFKNKVLQPFGVQPTEWAKVEINPPGRNRIEFQATRFVDANSASFLVYLHPGATAQVAIILRVSGAQVQSAEVKKGVDLTLQSLALGTEAEQQRQRFVPPPKPKP